MRRKNRNLTFCKKIYALNKVYKIRVICLYSMVYLFCLSVQLRKNAIQMYKSIAYITKKQYLCSKIILII